jgi:hypothetical protein
VGADNTLRQLQYLPVTTALDNQPDVVSSAHWNDTATCPASATLLDAMLQLLQSKAPSLTIIDDATHESLGSITLASINREITAAHAKIDTPTAAVEQEETRI